MAINQKLGNIGKTVLIGSQPLNPMPSDQFAEMKALVADLNAGKVNWLVILNANPIYTAPADLDFPSAFNKAQDGGAPGLACGRDGADCALAHSGGASDGDVVVTRAATTARSRLCSR